jgi:hypothetical protein
MELSDEKAWLAVLSKHFVGLAFSYQTREDMRWTNRSRFEIDSGFILKHNGRWFLATAGHVINDWLNWLKDGSRQITAQSLGFGMHSSETITAMPFDIFERQRRFADEEHRALDYALILLTDDDVRKLSEFSVQPLSIRNSVLERLDHFEGFCAVGLPSEFTELSNVSAINGGFGTAKLALIPLQRENARPLPGEYWNLQARAIDMGNQEAIYGMSGGPVFGFWREGGEIKYEVVAIQSRWSKHGPTVGVRAFLLTSVFDHVSDQRALLED